MSSNEGGEITSDEDRERVIGRAMLEYSEAKKALATFRVQFAQLGETLKSIGELLQLDRALHLVANNSLELVDAAKLRQALVEFKETEAKFQATKKTLQSLGVAID